MRLIDAETLYTAMKQEWLDNGIIDVLRVIDDMPTVDAVPLVKLKKILMQYFGIGSSCYTYELTRSKEAYELGTITIDDFTEWDEFQVDDLIEYIISRMDGQDETR